MWVTKSDFSPSNVAASFVNLGTASRYALVRSSSTPRGIAAMAIVNCSSKSVSGWSAVGDADSQADWICVGNRLLSTTQNGWSWSLFTAGGYAHGVHSLVLNNIVEKIGAGPENILGMAANSLQRFTHCVIEGNRFIGERANILYNDPPDLVSHDSHIDCRFANNFGAGSRPNMTISTTTPRPGRTAARPITAFARG